MGNIKAAKSRALGRQLLVELRGCDPKLIGDVAHVERVMISAARRAHCTVVKTVFHAFNPQGVSGVVVICESHLSIHTWPEHGLASIDLYTSSPKAAPELAVPVLAEGFKACRAATRELQRGVL